ncbi:hypothetical protein GBA52_019202 [Prunus armeniaca]|nr:hypothetical protein GBA52_019202 [Prunus armeniaca]
MSEEWHTMVHDTSYQPTTEPNKHKNFHSTSPPNFPTNLEVLAQYTPTLLPILLHYQTHYPSGALGEGTSKASSPSHVRKSHTLTCLDEEPKENPKTASLSLTISTKLQLQPFLSVSLALSDNNTHIISLCLHSLSKRLSDPSLCVISAPPLSTAFR